MINFLVKKSTIGNIFFTLVVVLYYYQVRIVGAVGVGEIAMILWLFTYIFQNGLKVYTSEPTIRLLFIFTFLWLFGALFSDIYNNVPIISTIKLVFSVGVLFLLILFLTYRVKVSPTQTIILFYLAIALSIYFAFFFVTLEVYKAFLLTQDYETFYRGYFSYSLLYSVIAFIGLTWYFNLKKIAFLLSFLSIFLFLYLGSRSLALVFIGSSGILLYYFLRAKHQNNRISLLKSLSYFLLFLTCTLFVLFSVYKLIKIPAKESSGLHSINLTIIEKSTGKLRNILMPRGSVVREKAEWSKKDDIPMYWDRKRFFQGVYAITQKPLGYGSTYDPNDFTLIEDANNFFNIPSLTTNEYVPDHSHIVGAALHSGVLALPFWLFMIYINLKLVLYNYAHTFASKFMMFIVPSSLSSLWAIFFSPFSDRILLAFSVSVYILIFTNTNRKNN